MWAAIVAALGAFTELSKDFKALVAVYSKYQDGVWRQQLSDISSKLSASAASPSDKADAAKKLADLISRL